MKFNTVIFIGEKNVLSEDTITNPSRDLQTVNNRWV